jgi:hypothetical protein
MGYVLLLHRDENYTNIQAGAHSVNAIDGEVLVAMRKCTWVNTLGSTKSSMIMIQKASALYCDKCRMYTTDMRMTLDWKYRIRAIRD